MERREGGSTHRCGDLSSDFLGRGPGGMQVGARPGG